MKFRRDKVIAVYDPEVRKEWLTGFHKRKLERRKAAADERADMEKAARRDAVRKVRTICIECMPRLHLRVPLTLRWHTHCVLTDHDVAPGG